MARSRAQSNGYGLSKRHVFLPLRDEANPSLSLLQVCKLHRKLKIENGNDLKKPRAASVASQQILSQSDSGSLLKTLLWSLHQAKRDLAPPVEARSIRSNTGRMKELGRRNTSSKTIRPENISIEISTKRAGLENTGYQTWSMPLREGSPSLVFVENSRNLGLPQQAPPHLAIRSHGRKRILHTLNCVMRFYLRLRAVTWINPTWMSRMQARAFAELCSRKSKWLLKIHCFPMIYSKTLVG